MNEVLSWQLKFIDRQNHSIIYIDGLVKIFSLKQALKTIHWISLKFYTAGITCMEQLAEQGGKLDWSTYGLMFARARHVVVFLWTTRPKRAFPFTIQYGTFIFLHKAGMCNTSWNGIMQSCTCVKTWIQMCKLMKQAQKKIHYIVVNKTSIRRPPKGLKKICLNNGVISLLSSNTE